MAQNQMTFELHYSIPASVGQVTSAFDDLKQRGQAGFANFHKIGPSEYRCSESCWVGPLAEVGEEPGESEQSEESEQALLSTVISLMVSPNTSTSRKKGTPRHRDSQKEEITVIGVTVDKWIGDWSNGAAASLDEGSTVVAIHETLDPMVSKIIDTINMYKMKRSLELD